MAYDDITFDMTEDIETINEKTVGGGGYAIPREYVIQKYLKERINPTIPTATILAALDQRKWEQKQAAVEQGPQQSVFEETISETETAMRPPMMPQGIAQGQPQQRPPMPGQMPTQMAGLQRPPMPGRVPPQRNDGIPMMAAAGGYVPNFADGGIIGYKDKGYVNYKPTFGLKKMQGYSSPTLDELPPLQQPDDYSKNLYTKRHQYIDDATDFNKKLYKQIYGGEREATDPDRGGRYSEAGQFFSFLNPRINTQAELDAEDYQRAKNQIRQEIRDTKISPWDVVSDTERGVAEDRIIQLEGMLTEIETLESGEQPGQKNIDKVIDNAKDNQDAGSQDDGNQENAKIQSAASERKGTDADLKDFMSLTNNMTKEEYQAYLDKQKPRDIINEGTGNIITDDELVKTLYGPEGRPEIETVDTFKERLSGPGSAFAKEQATTKEFREDLARRADKAGMNTDELMLRAGLGLMSSDKPAGRELQAIGEVGIGLTDEFIKRGDKADSIRDKARMLDSQLNKAETALELAAEKFGVNSKQHREKSRQFEMLYVQKADLAEKELRSKEYGYRQSAKAAGLTAMAGRQDKLSAALSKMDSDLLLTDRGKTLLTTVKKVKYNPIKDIRPSDIKAVKQYIQARENHYHNYNSSSQIKEDAELNGLKARIMKIEMAETFGV